MFIYKIDLMKALKDKEYGPGRIRTEKIMGEHTLQKIRTGEMIGINALDTVCRLLDMQPGSIIEYMPRDRVEALIEGGYFKNHDLPTPVIKEEDK